MSKGIIFATISTLCFAIGTVMVKYLGSINPIFLAFTSLFLGLVIMTTHNFITKIPMTKGLNNKRDITLALVAGPIGTGLAVWIALVGMQSLPANVAGFLLQFDNVACILIGVFIFKEPINTIQKIGIAIIFIGLTLLVSNQFNISAEGILPSILVSISGLLIGVGLSATKKLTTNLNPLQVTWIRLFGGTAFMLLVILFHGNIEKSTEFNKLGFTWAMYSITSFYFAYIFLSLAVKNAEIWKVSSIQRLTPIFIMALSFFMLRESISIHSIISAAVILVGVLFIANDEVKIMLKNKFNDSKG